MRIIPTKTVYTFDRCSCCNYSKSCNKLPHPNDYTNKDKSFKDFCSEYFEKYKVIVEHKRYPIFKAEVPADNAVEVIFNQVLAGKNESLFRICLNRGIALNDLGDYSNLIDYICKYNDCYNESHSNCGLKSNSNLCIFKEYFLTNCKIQKNN